MVSGTARVPGKRGGGGSPGDDLGVVAGETALDALDGALELEIGALELQVELGLEGGVLGEALGSLGIGGLAGGGQSLGVGVEGVVVGGFNGLLETVGGPLKVHLLDDLGQSLLELLLHAGDEAGSGLCAVGERRKGSVFFLFRSVPMWDAVGASELRAVFLKKS